MSLILAVILSIFFSDCSAYISSKLKRSCSFTSLQLSTITDIEKAPYSDIIPFLSEHVQPADQMLFVGAKSDLSLQLSKNGYGLTLTGFITVVDSDSECIERLRQQAESDPKLRQNMADQRLSFVTADLSNMPHVCRQSVFDCIVDYGGLDTVFLNGSEEKALRCIDHLQDGVRLGNILVCLSRLDKEAYSSIFDRRGGWVQELDGDPGQLSAWYRGKSNVQATVSNFAQLGLRMFVYTNTDNC